MSSYFNQTNITPKTPFANPGNNFSNGINLNGIAVVGAGSGQPVVIQPSNELFLGDGAGLSANYGVSSIGYANPTTGVLPILNMNVSTIAVSNLSSLQAGAFTVNASLMLSTIQGYGWA